MDMILRWLTPRDLGRVYDIEFDSFEFPWDKRDFAYTISRSNYFGLVADIYDESSIAGFIIVEKKNGFFQICNLACAPNYRRSGIGSKLVQRVITIAKAQKIVVSTEIRETNLAAQLFFRSNGFKAVKIVSDCYDESSEDAYYFRYDGTPRVTLTRPSEVTV